MNKCAVGGQARIGKVADVVSVALKVIEVFDPTLPVSKKNDSHFHSKVLVSKVKAFTFLFFIPSISFAYIDPGSGILIWQGLMVALGMVLVFIRNPIKFVKTQFQKIKNFVINKKID